MVEFIDSKLIAKEVLRVWFMLVLLRYALCQIVRLIMFDNEVARHQPFCERNQCVTASFITNGGIATFQRFNQVVVTLDASFIKCGDKSLTMFIVGEIGQCDTFRFLLTFIVDNQFRQ